jgi:hypothetical protein
MPVGYNTAGSLSGDLEEKKIGNADIVSGPWLPSRGNHKSVCGSLKRKKIKKRAARKRKRKKIDPWQASTPVPLDYFLTEVNGRLTDW